MTHKEQVWSVVKTLKIFTLRQAVGFIPYHNVSVVKTALKELVNDGLLREMKNGKFKVMNNETEREQG